MLLQCNNLSVEANVELPASKSISNRILILSEVLKLNTAINNLSESNDTELLQAAISTVYGNQKGKIDVGHAGTGLRFLTAWLSTCHGEWTLGGSERLQQRPISHLVNSLRELGADISYVKEEGYAPLLIRGKELRGGEVRIDPSVSSQFITALLLVAPGMKNGLIVHLDGEIVSEPYIQMTIEMLRQFGVEVNVNGKNIEVKTCEKPYSPPFYIVENDWSAASYWFSFVALSQNDQVNLQGLHPDSMQGDIAIMDHYSGLGVHSEFIDGELQLRKKAIDCDRVELDLKDTPDLAQTIAVTCFGLGISCKLTGLSTLKNKETDRIAALRKELEKLGAKVNVSDSMIEISSSASATTDSIPSIDTYNDHRMAMAFAPLVLKLGKLIINDPEVVTKSYPNFWKEIENAGVSLG